MKPPDTCLPTGAGARLSFSTGAFPPDQFRRALEWAARLPVAGIELGLHHAQPMAESKRTRQAARAQFERLGVRPLSVHAWTQVEGLPEVCPFAAEIGAGLIVVHCPDEAIARDFSGQVDGLTRWHEWCRERNLILTVENASIQPLAPFVRLFEAVPGLAMTLDIKHAYKPEKLGLTHADYLRALGDRVANLHMTGIDRARDELGDSTPPGRDAVDWRRLARDLADREYSGLVTMEWTYPSHLDAQAIERAYAGIQPATPGAVTLSERLTAWCAEFYRDKFSPILAEPAGRAAGAAGGSI